MVPQDKPRHAFPMLLQRQANICCKRLKGSHSSLFTTTPPKDNPRFRRFVGSEFERVSSSFHDERVALLAFYEVENIVSRVGIPSRGFLAQVCKLEGRIRGFVTSTSIEN
jgi:hypothetical protein